MLLQVFTVFDSKAEAYLPPFYMSAIGAALRNFGDTCSTPDHPFHKHPQDYCLFHIGSFDDATGHIELLTAPISLGLAQDHITQE